MGEEVAALVAEAERAEMWSSYRAATASLSPETHELMTAHDQAALRDATDRHGHAGTW